MFTTLLAGFFGFIQNAIVVFGYIQGGNLFPEPLSPEEEKLKNVLTQFRYKNECRKL